MKRWEKKPEKVNEINLDPRDNHTIRINGVEVIGIERIEIGVDLVTISFPAQIGVIND